MKKNLNQKLINLIEYYNLINANFLLSNVPIKRTNANSTNAFIGTKIKISKSLYKKGQQSKWDQFACHLGAKYCTTLQHTTEKNHLKKFHFTLLPQLLSLVSEINRLIVQALNYSVY